MNATHNIDQILNAKLSSGPRAYLWIQSDVGDCILWESEAEAENDSGCKAIGRWTLSQAEVEQLLASGEVNESN